MVPRSFTVITLCSFVISFVAIALFCGGIWYTQRIGFWADNTDVYEFISSCRGLTLSRCNTGEEPINRPLIL